MTLFRTEPPGAEPVTLAEAKAHLRLDGTGEDGLVAGLIRAAREEVERQAGLALIDQGWRLVLDDWPEDGPVRLHRHPVRAVTAVTVYDRAGEGSVMPASSYTVDAVSRPGRVLARERPVVGSALNGVEIDFRAGFGESGADVPDTLKRAILLLVGHWFEIRAGFNADAQPASMPAGIERLLAPFRARRLG